MPKSVRLNMNSSGKSGQHEVALQTMSTKCLVTDYDGTISPIHVARSESHVPLETRMMLQQISRSIPVSIITTKDLHFIRPRTPFARAWSAIGGLEIQIGKRILKNGSLESRLPAVSQALNYAGSHLTAVGIEIEEKQDSEGRTVAFCIDWRRAKNPEEARKEADRVTDYGEMLGLRVFKYENQPFCDVYPIAPDKGRALQNILSELAVKEGIIYLGDSEIDNSAFRSSNISIGVIHHETRLRTLECDYLVKFEDVPNFLQTLITHALLFSSDFPMIKTNSICPVRLGRK
ncbi:MAG: HAD-IIB family hydrolase [Candidatus Bathyarchaeia archaeon]